MRDRISFRREYFDEAKAIRNRKNRLLYYEAILNYGLYGILPKQLPRSALKAFERTVHHIDADGRSAAEIRNSVEYKNWRSAVYERDNYTCCACGSKGARLNAHHIKPFADFPNERLSIDNGITLCVVCHKKIHARR